MNYWVVGASWEGDNVAPEFYRRGYWEMGYNDEAKPMFTDRRNRIMPGDRVAVKTRDGRGASTITIRALGVVKEVAQGRVYIDWRITDLKRKVPSKNYFGTIHGPVTDLIWRNEAFSL